MYANNVSYRQEKDGVDRIAEEMAFKDRIARQSQQKNKVNQQDKFYNSEGEIAMPKTQQDAQAQDKAPVHQQQYEIGKIYDIDINLLRLPDTTLREAVDDEAMEVLAEDMKERGQQQNIVVKPDLTMVYGFRRRHAALKAGLLTLRCLVLDEEDPLLAAILENLLRQDNTAVQLAEGVKGLAEKYPDLAQGKLGDILQMHRTTVNVLLKIADLPEHMRKEFRNVHKIRQDKLKKLARLHEEPTEQEACFQQLLKKINTPKPKNTAQNAGDSGDILVTSKNKIIFAMEKAHKVRKYLDKLLPKDGKPLQSRDKKVMKANGKALYDELEALGLKIASILTYYNLNLRPEPQEPPADVQSGAAQPQTGEGEPGASSVEPLSAQDATDATNANADDELASEQEPSQNEPDAPADAAPPVLSGLPQADAKSPLMLPAGATPALGSGDGSDADDEASTTPQTDDEQAETDHAA